MTASWHHDAVISQAGLVIKKHVYTTMGINKNSSRGIVFYFRGGEKGKKIHWNSKKGTLKRSSKNAINKSGGQLWEANSHFVMRALMQKQKKEFIVTKKD